MSMQRASRRYPAAGSRAPRIPAVSRNNAGCKRMPSSACGQERFSPRTANRAATLNTFRASSHGVAWKPAATCLSIAFGFISRQHQRKGWGGVMVEACLDDAKKAGMSGAAVMVRDGPWLADRRLFLANGFEPVDTAPPDYQLLVRKFGVAPSTRPSKKVGIRNLGSTAGA